jgi:hypothetical protein
VCRSKHPVLRDDDARRRESTAARRAEDLAYAVIGRGVGKVYVVGAGCAVIDHDRPRLACERQTGRCAQSRQSLCQHDHLPLFLIAGIIFRCGAQSKLSLHNFALHFPRRNDGFQCVAEYTALKVKAGIVPRKKRARESA